MELAKTCAEQLDLSPQDVQELHLLMDSFQELLMGQDYALADLLKDPPH